MNSHGNMNEKIKGLFELGEADRSRHWPDYLLRGFEESDVPALIALLQDKSLHNADGQSNEVWVPLYAWRILAQLKSGEAVEPLIALFDTLQDDDWALSELPMVMGLIGEPAVKPLVKYFMDFSHQEVARIMAIDGLTEVAKRNLELKPQVIESFVTYMAAPDEAADGFNGLLVACLMDLDAVDTIESIRGMFAKGCIDISCAGDLEEVEIGMGLRLERSTPKPKYYPSFEAFDELPVQDEHTLEKPDGEDLYELLDYYLMLYGNDGSILGASELDGFFAALACSPDTVMPSTWMPAIWGGEGFMPEWPTKDALEEFSRMVFTLYNDVMQSMNEGDWQALFLEREVEGKVYSVVDDWCAGFLRGINLWRPLSAADAMVVEEQLQTMRLFATERGWEELDTLNDDEVEQAQQKIEPSVRQLYQYFLQRRSHVSAPVRRDETKVGRNDPCPCGSGKKFKKCCLH